MDVESPHQRKEFEERITVRLFTDIVHEAREHTRKFGYDNLSHYIRSAVMRLNREHQEMLKKQKSND